MANLGLHNNIWFDAMRAFKSYKSRKGSDNHDHVLDNLIHMGLIDWNKGEVSLAIQQFLCYPAIMADQLTKSHNDLVRQVGWLFIEVLTLLTTTLCSLEIIRLRLPKATPTSTRSMQKTPRCV